MADVLNVTPFLGFSLNVSRNGCLSGQMFIFSLVKAECPRNGCLLCHMFSMCHSKMLPTWMSFVTEVVEAKTFFWLRQSAHKKESL